MINEWQRFARADQYALTATEIEGATAIIESGEICVATIQRRLAIGWNRAADLIAHIKGVEALPPVARRLFP